MIRGAAVTNSVLASNVQVGQGSTLDEAVVLPHARVGSNCRLERVIVDEGVVIPDGTVVEAGHGVTLLAQRGLDSQRDDLRSVA